MPSWLHTVRFNHRLPASSIAVRAIVWLAVTSGLLLMARAVADALDSWLIGLVAAGVAALVATSITGCFSSRVPGMRS